MSESARVAPVLHPSTNTRSRSGSHFAGLVAACVASIGPAEKLRTTYSWPPASLPSGTPDRGGTRLLLAAQVPETLSVDVPCQTAPGTSGCGRPVTVLATSRSRDAPSASRSPAPTSELTYTIGDTILARVPADRAASRCRLRVPHRICTKTAGGRSPEAPRTRAEGRHRLHARRLRSCLGARPACRSRSVGRRHNRSARDPHDDLAGHRLVAAALASIVALVLVDSARVPRTPWRTLEAAACAFVRGFAPSTQWSASRSLWWVLSPAFYDDGWTIARQRGFETRVAFPPTTTGWARTSRMTTGSTGSSTGSRRASRPSSSSAYPHFSAWQPSGGSPDGRSADRATGNQRSRLPEWVLAGAFLAGAMAWGMTLRPEPSSPCLSPVRWHAPSGSREGGGESARPLCCLVPLRHRSSRRSRGTRTTRRHCRPGPEVGAQSLLRPWR